MRNSGFFLIWLAISFLITVQLSSCKKCEPYRSSAQLSEDQKAFIPNNPGDTLHFIDVNNKKFKLICLAKAVKPTGNSSTGHNNECDDSYVGWEYMEANFSGDLLCDAGAPLDLLIRINDPGYGYDSVMEKNNENCALIIGRPPLYFKFTSANAAQAVKGFLEGTSAPILKNFAFKPAISLSGKSFQNVYLQSVEHPGPETSCPTSKNKAIGIDSVYYSKQFGLIRLTTAGGKKYQRVL